MLEKLIGMTGDENTLFETIVFEVESNYDFYHSNKYDVVLRTLENQQFQIEQIIWRNDPSWVPSARSEYMKKKPWLYITGKRNKIDLLLCRVDLTIKSAEIYQDGNTEICLTGHMLDPNAPAPKPLTPEEIRLGFHELCGLLEKKPHKLN